VPQDVSDTIFSLVNDADPTKKALFSLSGITTGTTRSFSLPNTSSELAILAGTQTFTGNKTFSGTLTASGTVTISAASASIGTATTTATYGIGTGATTTGVTKTVNLGTGGASGSTTVVNIGSATAGAGGTTVVNTPTVTFANAVTQVGMPQANLTAQLLGLGGATADSYNRVSVNTPALLFNNAGAGIEATVNKAAAGNDAAFAFKTGFSARALIGLLGNDDFSFKVSPDGSVFFDAIKVDRTNGHLRRSVQQVRHRLVADGHDHIDEVFGGPAHREEGVNQRLVAMATAYRDVFCQFRQRIQLGVERRAAAPNFHDLRGGEADHAADYGVCGKAVSAIVYLAHDKVHDFTRLAGDRGFGGLQREVGAKRVFAVRQSGVKVRNHAELPLQGIEHGLVGRADGVAGGDGDCHDVFLLGFARGRRVCFDGERLDGTKRIDNHPNLHKIDTPGAGMGAQG
jgi:hypothetical protein